MGLGLGREKDMEKQMTATEIIAANGANIAKYTDEQREIVKAYGWEQYGLGFADTVRIETQRFDYGSYLDATFN